MCIKGDQGPTERPQQQPTQCEHPTANRDRFWDLKASHCVEVFLTIVLIGVGLLQYRVYTRQAGIMDKQNEITVQSSRAIVFARDFASRKRTAQFRESPVNSNPTGGSTRFWKMEVPRLQKTCALPPTTPAVQMLKSNCRWGSP